MRKWDMSIKELIEKSGRMEEVDKILEDTKARAASSIPVRLTLDNNDNPVYRVDGEEVLKGIEIWKELIKTTGECVSAEDSKDLFAFAAVIDTDLETRLHNYANSCAHRNSPEEFMLEEIRAYSILHSSLDFLQYGYGTDIDNTFIPFDIPDGWKKVA